MPLVKGSRQRNRTHGQAALPQRHSAHIHAGDAPSEVGILYFRGISNSIFEDSHTSFSRGIFYLSKLYRGRIRNDSKKASTCNEKPRFPDTRKRGFLIRLSVKANSVTPTHPPMLFCSNLRQTNDGRRVLALFGCLDHASARCFIARGKPKTSLLVHIAVVGASA